MHAEFPFLVLSTSQLCGALCGLAPPCTWSSDHISHSLYLCFKFAATSSDNKRRQENPTLCDFKNQNLT